MVYGTSRSNVRFGSITDAHGRLLSAKSGHSPSLSDAKTPVSQSRRLFGGHASALHYRTPLLYFALDEIVEVLRRPLYHRCAARHEGLTHLRVLRGAIKCVVESRYHLTRCSGRRSEAKPRCHLEAL